MDDSSPSVDEVKDVIRQAGLRATPARIATLILLRQSTSPLTHADVAEHLSASGVDKATAFRNLNDMAEAGLLRRTELGDRVWRFETVDPDGHSAAAHPHFVCIDCGMVSCLNNVELTAASQKQSEEFGQVTEILFRGHCKGCK